MGGWFSGPEEVGGVWAEEEEEEEGRFRCLYLPGDGRKEVWVAIGRRGKTAEFESRARPPPPRQSTMGPLTQLVKDGRVFAGKSVRLKKEKEEKRCKLLLKRERKEGRFWRKNT